MQSLRGLVPPLRACGLALLCARACVGVLLGVVEIWDVGRGVLLSLSCPALFLL